MSLRKVQQDVAKFMQGCGQEIRQTPEYDFSRITEAVLYVRLRLHEKELEEVQQGLKNFDMVEVAYGICDLIYAVVGTACALGIDLDTCWNEVQRTNMEKLDGPKSPEGKQLKPIGWQPPDIKGILEEQEPIDYSLSENVFTSSIIQWNASSPPKLGQKYVDEYGRVFIFDSMAF